MQRHHIVWEALGHLEREIPDLLDAEARAERAEAEFLRVAWPPKCWEYDELEACRIQVDEENWPVDEWCPGCVLASYIEREGD